jgi:hypothetical protein
LENPDETASREKEINAKIKRPARNVNEKPGEGEGKEEKEKKEILAQVRGGSAFGG